MCKNGGKHCPELRTLREIVVEFVDEIDDIRMIVCDVGLPDERIDFSKGTEQVWFEVIQEARRCRLVRALAERILGDYPQNELLRAWLESFKCELPEPQKPPPKGGDGSLWYNDGAD